MDCQVETGQKRPGWVDSGLPRQSVTSQFGHLLCSLDRSGSAKAISAKPHLSPLDPHQPTNQMSNTSVRTEIAELEQLGPLPSEDEAEVAQLARFEALYRAIAKPITDNEACVLVELFGPDGCFGLASSLMHLIETAPGWPLKDCLAQLDSDWKIELRNRAIRGGHQFLG